MLVYTVGVAHPLDATQGVEQHIDNSDIGYLNTQLCRCSTIATRGEVNGAYIEF